SPVTRRDSRGRRGSLRLGSAMITVTPESRLLRAVLVPLVILAWLAVGVLVGWLLSHLTHNLVILVLATVVAVALTPLVTLFTRWLARVLAIAVAYVAGFAFVVALMSVVVVSAATEITNLAHNLPSYAHNAQSLQPQVLRLLSPFGITQDQLNQAQSRLISFLQGISAQVAADAFDFVRSVLNTIIDTVLILILSAYLVANGPGVV